MSATDAAVAMERFRVSDVAAWKVPLIALAIVWMAVVALFWDTAATMVAIWYRSGTFNHCFLVLPISAWLVWRQRYGLSRFTPRPSPIFLLPVAGIAVMWLLGDLVAVNSVTQLAFVAMLVLAVPVILGAQVALAITFPLLFLFFGVPIGEFLMPQLMESTADFTVAALRLSGVPVLREGLQFVIPTGNWSVVEACSGVRYLIASLTVGTLFAYLNYHSTKRRLLFVLVSLLVPIVANWMRAYMIVMLGHLSGNRLAVGVDHLIYGWIFFGVVILLMFIMGARWSEPEQLSNGPASAARYGNAGASNTRVVLVTLVFGVIVALPDAAQWTLNREQVVTSPVLAAPSALSGSWRQTVSSAVDYKPGFRNPSAEINAAYANGSGTVGLYVGYYRNQHYERKLVSSENVLVTSNDTRWARVHGGTRLTPVGQEVLTVRDVEMRQMGPLSSGRDLRLVAWQVYWIDGTLTSNDYVAKALSVAKRLMGRGDESAVIVVYTEQSPSVDANNTLEVFLSANYEAINTMLRQTRGGN